MGTPLAIYACSLGLPGTLCTTSSSLLRRRPSLALQRRTDRVKHAKPVNPSCSLASPQQHPPGALAEAAAATKVRVERQTHLPASREEAWGALRQLVSREQWRQLSAVFAALESIYRAELQMSCEETLHALRTANEALEQLPDLAPRRRKRIGRQDENGSEGGNGAGPPAVQQQQHEQQQQPPMGNIPLAPTPASAKSGNGAADGHASLEGDAGSDPSSDADNGAVRLESTSPKGLAALQERFEDVANGREGSIEPGGSINAPGSSQKEALAAVQHGIGSAVGQAREVVRAGRTALEERQHNGAEQHEGAHASPAERRSVAVHSQDEASDAGGEPEVVEEEEGTLVENASRLDWDRRRLRRPSDLADPDKADAAFVACLLNLLRKAHFTQLNARDEAMSRSLNSDYLDQLLIRADVSRLDAELVRRASEGRPVPEEEHSLLVFKRGYGQARRKGRMLVAKLDHLQLVVIRGSLAAAAKRTGQLWRALRSGLASEAPGSPEGAALDVSSRDADDEEEETLLERLRGGVSSVTGKLADWGVLSPRLMLAGGGLFMTLSNWGLLPSVDVLPLERFNAVWRPDEPERLRPVYVERVTIREALRAPDVGRLLGSVQLVEPTFQELFVLYRRKPKPNWLAEVRRRIVGPEGGEKGGAGNGAAGPRLIRREPITLRVLRDIPVPSWKLVFPDKLLQFRPLDGLRADLLTVAGLAAFVAQAKYDSFILEAITAASAVTLITRVVLGYQRMAQRYDKLANEVLAESTISGGDSTVQYLASAAALQQWEQAALAFLMLHMTNGDSTRQLGADSLAEGVESLLEDTFQVRVRFDADEALGELARLHLLQPEEASANGSGAPRTYRTVAPERATQQLQEHWNNLLLKRLSTVVQEA